jgi:hypothetical protein
MQKESMRTSRGRKATLGVLSNTPRDTKLSISQLIMPQHGTFYTGWVGLRQKPFHAFPFSLNVPC